MKIISHIALVDLTGLSCGHIYTLQTKQLHSKGTSCRVLASAWGVAGTGWIELRLFRKLVDEREIVFFQ